MTTAQNFNPFGDQTAALFQIGRAMETVVSELSRLSHVAHNASEALQSLGSPPGAGLVNKNFLLDLLMTPVGVFSQHLRQNLFGMFPERGGRGGGFGGGAGVAPWTQPAGAGMLFAPLGEHAPWGAGGGADVPGLLSELGAPGPADVTTSKVMADLAKTGMNLEALSHIEDHLKGLARMPDELHKVFEELNAFLKTPEGAMVVRGSRVKEGKFAGMGAADINRVLQAVALADAKFGLGDEMLTARRRHRDRRRDALLEEEHRHRLAQAASERGDKRREAFHRFILGAGDVAFHATRKGLAFGGQMVESASPDAFATLSSSFKLLMASLGTALLPTVVRVSSKVQDLAFKFNRLDDASKGAAGSLMLGGLGLAAAGVAVTKLYGLFQATSSMLGGFGLTGSLFSAPALMTGAGAAGVGMYLGYQARAKEARLYSMAVNSDRVSGGLRPEHMLGAYTDDVVRGDLKRAEREMRGEFGPGGPKAARNYLMRASIREQEEAARYRDLLRYESTGFEGFMSNVTEFFLPEESESRYQTAQAASRHELRASILRARAQTVGMDAAERKEWFKVHFPAAADLKEEQSVIGAHNLLLDLQHRIQPAYYGVEDAYRQIQMETLAASPLQQAIRQIQLDNLERLLGNIDENTKQLIDVKALRDSS